jgi:hypothetical protein
VGAARNRRWRRLGCNDGEQRRRAVQAGGRAACQGEEKASVGWGSAAQTLGQHVARLRAVRGRPVRGTWPTKRRGVGRREREEKRGWRLKTRVVL